MSTLRSLLESTTDWCLDIDEVLEVAAPTLTTATTHRQSLFSPPLDGSSSVCNTASVAVSTSAPALTLTTGAVGPQPPSATTTSGAVSASGYIPSPSVTTGAVGPRPPSVITTLTAASVSPSTMFTTAPSLPPPSTLVFSSQSTNLSTSTTVHPTSASTPTPPTAGPSHRSVPPSSAPTVTTDAARPLTPIFITALTSCILPMLSPMPNSPPQLQDQSLPKLSSPSSSDSEGPLDRGVIIRKKKIVTKNKRRSKAGGGTCSHIFKKGPKKEQRCSAVIGANDLVCSRHARHKSKETKFFEQLANSKVGSPIKKKSWKTKINRLKPNCKYYLIQKVNHVKSSGFVLVKNDDTFYKLRVPSKLTIPDGKGWYLFRENRRSHATWKKDHRYE